MKDEITGGIIGVALSATGTALQTNELLQTISLIITILGGLVSFVIIPLYNWHKSAKKDGKITSDEIKEAADIVKGAAEKAADEIERRKGEK